jgi:hypothetical protein
VSAAEVPARYPKRSQPSRPARSDVHLRDVRTIEEAGVWNANDSGLLPCQ